MSLLMRKKSRYGINVRFACKLCPKSCFETVEDYIEHKIENHYGEFEKNMNKCFIIFEERNLSSDDNDNNFYDEIAVDVDVVVAVGSQSSLPLTPSKCIPLKKERNECDGYDDLEDSPLSTNKTRDDFFTNISADLNENGSPVEVGFTNYKCNGTDPDSASQQFSETNPLVQNETEDETQNKIIMDLPSTASNQSSTRFDPEHPSHCCNLCLRTFHSKPALTIHGNICVLYHPKRGSYCAQCNNLFSDTNALRHHMFTFHTKTNSKSQESKCIPVVVDDKYSDPLAHETPEPPPPPKKMKSNVDAGPGPTVKDNLYPKPKVSFRSLIAMALKNSKTGSLQVGQMYKFVSHIFPYFESQTGRNWKSSLRHTLCRHISTFGRIDKIENGRGVPKKGRWVVDPLMVQKLDELVYKQLDANRDNIRRAMRCPQDIDNILRGEFRGDFENLGDDEENGDLTFVTESSQVQQARRESWGNSSSSADSCLTEPTSPICANTPYEPSQQQQFSTDQNYLYASKTHVKSEPDPAVTSDFCEIINVQGNYSR